MTGTKTVFQCQIFRINIDCSPSWHDHIDYISNKISKSVNVIAKPTSQSLTSIYYALIHQYLTYGCTLWGNNYKAPLSQLVRQQNKAIRIINNVPLRDHITPHCICKPWSYYFLTLLNYIPASYYMTT